METSRSPSPVAPPADAAAQAGLLSVPAATSSMTEDDYTQLVSALSTAAGLLSSRRGELNAADLRIRSLVNIAEKEARRALLEMHSRHRPVDAPSQTSVAT